MITLTVPTIDDVAPWSRFSGRRIVTTDAERSEAMDNILDACKDNLVEFVAVDYALRRGYSIKEIGTKYFCSRLDEARAVRGMT